jgi:capsular polysaccharide biosynthesis protein
MKQRLLDRLIARQGRLMAELAPPPAASAQATRPRHTVSEVERAAESAAVDAAMDLLNDGDIGGAQRALEPFEGHATDVRTLTILARLRVALGQTDDALALLDRAESIDATDIKVAFHKAELLDMLGRHREAVTYRRRVAYHSRVPSAKSLFDLLRSVAKGAIPGKPPASELRMVLDHLVAAPDREPLQVLGACQTVYAIKALREQAEHLYTQTDPCPINMIDVDAVWQPRQVWAQAAGSVFRTLADEGKPGRRPQAAQVSGALVAPALEFTPLVADGAVVISGWTNASPRLRHQRPESPLLLTSARTCRLRLPKERRFVAEPCILIGGAHTYEQNLIDHVGTLAVAERLGMSAGRKVVLPEPTATEQADLLEMLGCPRSTWLTLRQDEVARFDDLVVASPLAQGRRWIDPIMVAWYRERLAPDARAQTHLYVSRRKAASRHVDDEDAVESALRDRGFEIIHPEDLSTKDQIRRFSRAATIVGVTGDALANMLFAPPGARIVVMVNGSLGEAASAFTFEALAAASGHRCTRLGCAVSRMSTGASPTDADLHVDLDVLLASLTD